MKKVVVTREMFDETIEYLDQHVSVVSNQTDRSIPRDELIALLQDADGMQSYSSDRVDAELLKRCPSIRAVCNTAVGYNNIDVDACTRHGVMVTNTPGVLDDSVADYAIGLMIATCRRMSEGERYLRKGDWKTVYLKQTLGKDVHGATLGIVGFGRIGQAIAKRARGFDTNILYHTRKWWGDVLLIPKQKKAWFRAGILAFLAGHLAYVAAFLHLPKGWMGLAMGSVLSAILAGVVLSWLGPKLPQAFRRLVVVYVAVICSMLVAAFWAADGSGIQRIALGASLFALSDISVARDRFVSKAFINRAWGLPLYFAAQLILASTVAG